MNHRIVITNFSGIYQEESFWKEHEISWVDLSDISGTNCYCDGEAMEEILLRIKEFPIKGIHFIDSGNYHYMSGLWLEKTDQPFRLLVFDNHTDMQLPAFGGLLSCGGWIAAALEENHFLQEVILVGPDEEAYHQVEPEFQAKVRFLSREALQDSQNPDKLHNFLESISTELPLYISIDKDILCKEDASTTWSQGDMTLADLISCLTLLIRRIQDERGEILGIDICGEADRETPGESEKNDKANEFLLNALSGI